MAEGIFTKGREEKMANINDPATWGEFSKTTQDVLYRIRELFIEDISQFTKENQQKEEN